jgi:hypothetical protein
LWLRWHVWQGENLICDGTQWSLDVRYEDGFWISYHGDNSFPENWVGLLNLFGIHDDDDQVERMGKVKAIEYYSPEDVPYPIDKIKRIIRRNL